MFEDLLTETMNVITRSNKFKDKVNEMKEKYKMFEKEEIRGSLNAVNIENEKAPSQNFDQQILSSESRSNAIKTIYEAANPPPAITGLNQFREDGTDGLKLYTDPTFFFMHWFSQMQKKEPDYREHEIKMQNETSMSEPSDIYENEDATTSPVPLRHDNEICHNTQSVLPAPPDDRHIQLPPPPPDDRYSQLPLPPPTPPPNQRGNDQQIYLRKRVALPPDSRDFYQNDKENSVIQDRDSMFPLPPTPDLLELDNDEQMDSLMEPPPPLVITSNMIRILNKLKAKRISTFVMTSGMEKCDNIDGRQCTKLIDYPGASNVPPLPVPGLPPQPNRSVSNDTHITTESLTAAGVFTENSLLAIKKNLKQAKERKTPAQTMKTQTNQLDVNTIMNRALEGHRQFIEYSSSDEDDSDFSDSDSDWN
ncbi:unnamed protein product [Mytilus coruscus]|uniref:Uncharacterized protein n=1 Tax=Mytilus coruscus TaxID=42192 RepID=A0A6J7ZVJ2_MYTCO|nr:unnamed protein product [Mytilus coruscus]